MLRLRTLGCWCTLIWAFVFLPATSVVASDRIEGLWVFEYDGEPPFEQEGKAELYFEQVDNIFMAVDKTGDPFPWAMLARGRVHEWNDVNVSDERIIEMQIYVGSHAEHSESSGTYADLMRIGAMGIEREADAEDPFEGKYFGGFFSILAWDAETESPMTAHGTFILRPYDPAIDDEEE